MILHFVQNDLHFYLSRMTDSNVGAWRDFALSQQSLAAAYEGEELARKLADKGFKAFLPILDYVSSPRTEVWAAFVSNKPWDNRAAIPHKSVEMFVSMITSIHACFTGHMGIARTLSYEGERHAGLSILLHAFTAFATLQLEKGKSYMLSVPASRMREMLAHALAEADAMGGLCIGDGCGPVRLRGETVEHPGSDLAALLRRRSEMRASGADRRESSLHDYERNELAISLIMQEEARQKSGSAPFVTASKVEDGSRYESFTLLDRHGRVIQALGESDMSGEFGWFFESPYFVRNPRQPLIAADLEVLASLGRFSGKVEIES